MVHESSTETAKPEAPTNDDYACGNKNVYELKLKQTA